MEDLTILPHRVLNRRDCVPLTQVSEIPVLPLMSQGIPRLMNAKADRLGQERRDEAVINSVCRLCAAFVTGVPARLIIPVKAHLIRRLLAFYWVAKERLEAWPLQSETINSRMNLRLHGQLEQYVHFVYSLNNHTIWTVCTWNWKFIYSTIKL